MYIFTHTHILFLHSPSLHSRILFNVQELPSFADDWQPQISPNLPHPCEIAGCKSQNVQATYRHATSALEFILLPVLWTPNSLASSGNNSLQRDMPIKRSFMDSSPLWKLTERSYRPISLLHPSAKSIQQDREMGWGRRGTDIVFGTKVPTAELIQKVLTQSWGSLRTQCNKA